MFLVISETNINIFYIINIVRIKRNFRFIVDKTVIIKIIIIIKITAAIITIIIIIRFILFIIRKSIIRY